jgi:hypothetical protein
MDAVSFVPVFILAQSSFSSIGIDTEALYHKMRSYAILRGVRTERTWSSAPLAEWKTSLCVTRIPPGP